MTKKVQRPADQPLVNPPESPHPGIAGPIGELQRQVSLGGANTPDEFMTALSDVVRRNDEFLDLFGGTAWGTIVWERDVGLPLSAKLNDAFAITHKFQEIKGVANPDGTATNVGGWKDAPTPELWDGPHDEAHYRVSFMLHGQPPWTNGVGIALNRNVQWEPRAAPWLAERARYVEYPSSLQQTAGAFWPTKDGVTELEDFQVLWSPF